MEFMDSTLLLLKLGSINKEFIYYYKVFYFPLSFLFFKVIEQVFKFTK